MKKKKKYYIKDNFLEQSVFDKLQTIIMGEDIAWYYSPTIVYSNDEDRFQFVHHFYGSDMPQSEYIEQIRPIIEIIKPTTMIRIKANLLTITPKIVENPYHHDLSNYDDENGKTIYPERLEQITTSIFYMNTNNGYTKFEHDGTKVECVANRLVTFPCSLQHCGTSCTDQKKRVVINFNYFK